MWGMVDSMESNAAETGKSKSLRILELIGASGTKGLKLGEIQRLLWEMSNPGVPFTNAQRGYWCTNLLYRGFLAFFCAKGEDRRWRLTRTPTSCPWAEVNRHTGFTV